MEPEPKPEPPAPLPEPRTRVERELAANEHFAMQQMHARAQYNAMVKREADAGRDVSKFPTYKLAPNRATRRRIQALRKRAAK